MLSEKQKEVLNFINNYQSKHGHTPTLDEIATKFRRSIPTVHEHVTALRNKGYLKSASVNSRNIGVVRASDELEEVPLLGYISAGEGIENIENPESISVQKSLLSPSGVHFALVVKGTSMIQDGIVSDDVVLVKEQEYADNGDVVIALTGGEGDSLATIKRFYNHGNKIELRPRNPEMHSKWYNKGEVEIRGKFIGLLRKGN